MTVTQLTNNRYDRNLANNMQEEKNLSIRIWLRAVQFQGNTTQKEVTVICTELWFLAMHYCFSPILLIGNRMVSCAIGKNIYT